MPTNTASRRPRREKLSQADRSYVYQRDRGICQHCWEPVNRFAYDIDHVKRVVGGGGNLRSNLILSHQRCNRRRGSRTLAEWREVLRVENSHKRGELAPPRRNLTSAL